MAPTPTTFRRVGIVQVVVGLLFAWTAAGVVVPALLVAGGAAGVLTPVWRDNPATESLPVEWWHVGSASNLLIWAGSVGLFADMGMPGPLFAVVAVLSGVVFAPIIVDLALGGRFVFPDLRAESPA